MRGWTDRFCLNIARILCGACIFLPPNKIVFAPNTQRLHFWGTPFADASAKEIRRTYSSIYRIRPPPNFHSAARRNVSQ